MEHLQTHPTVRLVEEELENSYLEAVTYSIRYHSGWERAAEAYHRLRAFKETLARAEAPPPAERRPLQPAA